MSKFVIKGTDKEVPTELYLVETLDGVNLVARKGITQQNILRVSEDGTLKVYPMYEPSAAILGLKIACDGAPIMIEGA